MRLPHPSLMPAPRCAHPAGCARRAYALTALAAHSSAMLGWTSPLQTGRPSTAPRVACTSPKLNCSTRLVSLTRCTHVHAALPDRPVIAWAAKASSNDGHALVALPPPPMARRGFECVRGAHGEWALSGWGGRDTGRLFELEFVRRDRTNGKCLSFLPRCHLLPRRHRCC
jgi:hypothetical protein